MALVTGAASGIGRETAGLLAEHRAALALLDRVGRETDELAREIGDRGGRARAYEIDLASTAAIPPVVEAVLREFSRIDVLVNCAGISGAGAPLVEADEDEWDRIHAVNLKAPFVLMKHVARHMIERGDGGRIVNVSSSSAFRARMAFPAYASSKAGLVQLSRGAAAELGPHGINVNAVAPGLTRTGMTSGIPDAELEQLVREGPLANLLGRASTARDLAEGIVFLCLPASRQITGQTLHVSAGAIC